MSKTALVNIKTKRVRTIVATADIEPNWKPPRGYKIVPEADLPLAWIAEGDEINAAMELADVLMADAMQTASRDGRIALRATKRAIRDAIDNNATDDAIELLADVATENPRKTEIIALLLT